MIPVIRALTAGSGIMTTGAITAPTTVAKARADIAARMSAWPRM
jgi:hypothetical protein